MPNRTDARREGKQRKQGSAGMNQTFGAISEADFPYLVRAHSRLLRGVRSTDQWESAPVDHLFDAQSSLIISCNVDLGSFKVLRLVFLAVPAHHCGVGRDVRL